MEQLCRSVGRVPDQDTRIRPRFRIDPDDGLAVEILRRVGHEPVLTHHSDDVLRGEQEAAQVGALHLGVTPLGRNSGADGRQCRGEQVMALLHILERAAAGPEEEFGLAAGGVPVQEFLEFGAPVDDDETGVCHDRRLLPDRDGCRSPDTGRSSRAGRRFPEQPGECTAEQVRGDGEVPDVGQ